MKLKGVVVILQRPTAILTRTRWSCKFKSV